MRILVSSSFFVELHLGDYLRVASGLGSPFAGTMGAGKHSPPLGLVGATRLRGRCLLAVGSVASWCLNRGWSRACAPRRRPVVEDASTSLGVLGRAARPSSCWVFAPRNDPLPTHVIPLPATFPLLARPLRSPGIGPGRRPRRTVQWGPSGGPFRLRPAKGGLLDPDARGVLPVPL